LKRLWNKKKLLIWLLLTEERRTRDSFFLDEEPEISLNAITGTPNPKTMRIIGVLRNQKVVILIDSGSTHNFVDAKLAEVLGIISTNGDAIKVRIANGQIINIPGMS
jgi:hypothetical protein